MSNPGSRFAQMEGTQICAGMLGVQPEADAYDQCNTSTDLSTTTGQSLDFYRSNSEFHKLLERAAWAC